MLEYRFNKVTLLKRDSNTGVFLRILQNFQEQLFYRTPLVAASDLCKKYVTSSNEDTRVRCRSIRAEVFKKVVFLKAFVKATGKRL